MPQAPTKAASSVSAQIEWLARVLGLSATVASGQTVGSDARTGGLAEFNKRLAGLIGTLKPALEAKHPDALDAKLKVSEAGVFARKQDFARAHALLDDAEALLGNGPDKTPGADAEPATATNASLPGSASTIGKAVVSVDQQAIRAAVAAWREASDTVDAQIGRLQAVLQRSDDPELREIGEYGMAALSGGNRTRLMAAMVELARPDPPSPAVLKRTAGITANFRAHLAGDDKVRGFDNNPFGLAVSIRATLDAALRQLETAISTSTG